MQSSSQGIGPSDIQGKWSIVSWLQIYDDGRRTAPMGEALKGFIRYLGDGDMICMIARADRSPFASGGQWDASDTEKSNAYNGMLAYAGRYRIEGDMVIHIVETCLYPNWEGGEQRRQARIVGDELFIEARLEQGTPQARTAQLRWARASNG